MKNCFLMLYFFVVIFSSDINAWENINTHPSVTEFAINSETCVLGNYLNILGFSGLDSEFEYPTLDRCQDIRTRLSKEGFGTEQVRNVLDWIKLGSLVEDSRFVFFLPRFKHHFHDPVNNRGLNNSTFIRGKSTFEWLTYSENTCSWQSTRESFYRAMIEENKDDRESLLAETFFKIGHFLHLIEDMGVPEHTRNDSLYAHYRPDNSSKPGSVYGSPFESWVEMHVKTSGGTLNRWISSWSPSPVIFERLVGYFDTDTRIDTAYLGNGYSPPSSWGLSEATNYQFLSWSTIFINTGDGLYYFPHPAFIYTTPFAESGRLYLSGYEINHLCRTTISGDYLIHNHLNDFYNVLGKSIWDDYAEITIPRTINYATGLVNYFFRGRLSVEPNGVDEDGNIEIEIKNTSINTDSEQALVGGTFELYWDNDANERAAVEGFGVDGWSSSSVLDYDETVLARFPVFTPEDTNIVQYVLVYKGPINPSSDPDNSDEDDQLAIAVDMFKTNLGNVVSICWIDEADSIYTGSSSNYNTDLQAYRDIISSNNANIVKGGCLVPGNPPSGVLPSGYSAPEEVSIQTCGRPPSQSELTDDFNRIRDGIVPDYLILCVDNSGSMHTADIEPGYSNFKTWIRNNYSSTIIVEYSFTTERWFNEMKTGIQNAIDNLNN